jgi:hypothetical protein
MNRPRSHEDRAQPGDHAIGGMEVTLLIGPFSRLFPAPPTGQETGKSIAKLSSHLCAALSFEEYGAIGLRKAIDARAQ